MRSKLLWMAMKRSRLNSSRRRKKNKLTSSLVSIDVKASSALDSSTAASKSCTSFNITMQTSHSTVDAPPPSVPLEVDVRNRDRDDAGIESSHCINPYDDLYEILSWMPAKTSIKYSSSLCKWLCNIHSEPRFIKKQCIHSFGQDSGFFLQHNLNSSDFGPDPNAIQFRVLPWQSQSTFGMPRKSLRYLPKHGRIFSSSNGLLLLGNKDVKFRVCNPATREWAPLCIPKVFNSLKFKIIVNKNFSPLIECNPR